MQANKVKMVEKDCLTEALARLAFAAADSTVEDYTTFDDTLRQLNSWLDIESSPKLSTLRIVRDIRSGLYGSALKQINKILDDETKDKDSTIRPMTRSNLIDKRVLIYEKLGFDSLLRNDIRVRAVSCPKSYSPF
jgi:hypothetical protein